MSAKWVLLADPKDYGWPELQRDGRAVWDGIRNTRAQSNLRRMTGGDLALLYHTAPDKAITGIVRITGAPRPDPADESRVVVDVAPVQPLAQPLPLADMKADEVLAGMGFVRMPRVAVWPVEDAQWRRVLDASGTRLRR